MYFNYLDEEPQNRNDVTPEASENETQPTVSAPEAEGRLERLFNRVQELMRESTDSAFTEYLRQMRGRIINQQYQIDLLADELERRCRMYGMNRRPDAGSIPAPQLGVEMIPASQSGVEVPPAPQPGTDARPMPGENPQPFDRTMPGPAPRTAGQTGQPKNNLEFTVGAAVLSIVGSVFILIALVLLGINFLNGFVKGMSLYAICLAVMALSEFLLYKKWPKLGMTFSAVGMGGLYLSTLLNYLWLHNFNMWVAFGLTCLITVGVILLSRKKDAVVYRILGMAAVYVCILMLPTGSGSPGGGVSQAEFLAVVAILFLINVMCLLVPVRRSYTAVNVTHMALNTLFTMIVCAWQVADNSWPSFAGMWHHPFFVAGSFLIVQMIFVFQLRWQAKQKSDMTLRDSVGICIAYVICVFLYCIMAALTTDFLALIDGLSRDVYLIHRLVCAAVVMLICVAPMLALRGRPEKWFSWYSMNLLLLVIYLNALDSWELAWCATALLAVTKLLSFTKDPMLRFSDAPLTALVCLTVVFDPDQAHVIPLFVALVLSVPCLNYWKTYFETILTLAIAYYTSVHMLPMLKLPVFVGILFAGMLLFNNVGRWKDRRINLYNYIMLAGQGLCCLALLDPVYRNAWLTYLCMLVFGVTTIVICFREQYGMDFRSKQMILVIFLTYMALVMRTGYPIVNSILLMLVALVAVGTGFWDRRKNVRVYGLVLSLADCGKIVLYDFHEATVFQRTLVFFVVGVLALAISAIYMILEKKQGRMQTDTENEIIREGQEAI